MGCVKLLAFSVAATLCVLVASTEDAELKPPPTTVVVVGSGPGGTGFLKHALEITETTEFVWLESGDRYVLTEWPQGYSDLDSREYLSLVKRTSSSLLGAARFHAFGGGAVLNSGGPLTLMDSSDARLQRAINKYGKEVLDSQMESSFTTDPSSDEWLKRYENAGYERASKFLTQPSRSGSEDKEVGYCSTTFYEEENGNPVRKQLAEQVARDHRVTLLLNTKVMKVLFDEGNNSVGVECEDGTVYAGDRVVLAAGVFGTFEILLRSGIGDEANLKNAEVNPIPYADASHGTVGKRIGDDAGMLFLHEGGITESNQASHGADIVAVHGDLYSITHWGKIVSDALMAALPFRFTDLTNQFLRLLSSTTSLAKVDMPAEYNMDLVVKPKMIRPWWIWWADDTQPMLELVDSADRWAQGGGCIEDDDFAVLSQANLAPGFIVFLAKNLDTAFITSDKQCAGDSQKVSNHHYHGGAQEVTDGNFEVKGTKGLFISDASVTEGYRFGAPETNIYLIGYAVADAMLDWFSNTTVPSFYKETARPNPSP